MKARLFNLITAVCLLLACLASTQLNAADKYWGGGLLDIANGTPLPYDTNALVGTWNDTLKNWAASPDGATYTTFADGDHIQLGYYTNLNNTTITLENDFEIAGMQGSMNAITGGFNWLYQVRALSAKTLTPVSGGALFNVVAQDATRGFQLQNNVSLAGSAPVTKVGNGKFELTANNNAYTGVINVRQGNFAVSSAGSLNGVQEINCVGRVTLATTSGNGGNDFGFGGFNPNAASPSDNKLADDLVITLDRGGFGYVTAATSTETVGRVVLNSWGTLGTSSSGTAGGVLILGDATAGITRGPYGVGALCMPVDAGAAPRVRLKVPNGVPKDTLLPWLVTTRAEFMQIVSAADNTVTRIAATDAATDLSTWDSTYDNTSNVRVGNGTAVTLSGYIDANTTVKSLAFNNSSATTLTNADGVTLTIDAGAIAFAPNGSSPGGNQTISGGSLASGTSYLYLNPTDSGSSSTLNIYTPIIGAIDVIKSGMANVQFLGSSANTYSGTTYVNSSTLTANKSGGAIAIPGDAVIQNGGALALNSANAIAAMANVTINSGGLLYGGANQTYSGTVTINGGTLLFINNVQTFDKSGTGLAFNGGFAIHNSTATGTLNLQTDVSYAAGSATQARFERLNTGAYNIELDGGNRTFNVADSTTLANGVPEMVIDTAIIPGSPAGGSITKTGAGILQITDRATYTGGTTINGGVLQVSRINAPAQSGLTAFTSQTGNGQGLVVFNAPVAKNMAVRQPISGTTIAANRLISRVLSDYEVICNGANLLPATNHIVGPVTAVSAIERAGSLGTGPVAVNNTGTLQIDAGVSITNYTEVNLGGTLLVAGELADAVVNSGTVQGNGTVLALTNAAGGVVAPGASVGVMTFNGSVVLEDDSVLELEWSDSVTNDVMVVNGNFTANGAPVIKVLNIGGTPAASTQVVLKVTGTYAGPVAGYQFDLPVWWTAITDGGDLIDLGGGNYGIAFLPEPGAVMMALLAVLGVRRR